MCPPISPETDERLTIAPPLWRSSGIAYLQPRNVPSRLIASTCFQVAKSSILHGSERDDARGVDEPVEPAVLAGDVVMGTAPLIFGGHVERDVGVTFEIGGERDPAGGPDLRAGR